MSGTTLKYFTPEELKCPTTGQLVLAPGFGEALDAFREKFGQSMTVTSGCRTSEHNEWLKGRGYPASKNSFHLIGNTKYGTDTCAVDIARKDGVYAAQLIKLALNEGWTCGVAKSFIHIDLRTRYTELPQVVYNY